MVTSVLGRRPTKASRLPGRKLLVAAMLGALALVIAQANPAAWIERIPDEYVPNAIQRYLPAPGQAMLGNAFLYQQQRPLSCEYASVTIAATMGGWNISEWSFDAVVPLSDNPHLGYRGNIHGEWGNTTDYGLYPEPLHAALSGWGIPSEVIYARGNADVLRSELSAGNPVVVWLAMHGPVNSFEVQPAEGSSYQLTQYMHVMTAYGFDETGVYLTDPGTAVWRHYGWDEFMDMWNVMDGMALSVHPNESAVRPAAAVTLRRQGWIEIRMSRQVFSADS